MANDTALNKGSTTGSQPDETALAQRAQQFDEARRIDAQVIRLLADLIEWDLPPPAWMVEQAAARLELLGGLISRAMRASAVESSPAPIVLNEDEPGRRRIPRRGVRRDSFETCLLYEIARQLAKTHDLNQGVDLTLIAERLGAHYGVTAGAIHARVGRDKYWMKLASEVLDGGRRTQPERVDRLEAFAVGGYESLPPGFSKLKRRRFRK